MWHIALPKTRLVVTLACLYVGLIGLFCGLCTNKWSDDITVAGPVEN